MAQRVTNSMLISNYNRNLNTNTVKMMKLQENLATNKKISRLSDDPVGVVKALNARAKRRDIQQYQRNIDDARSFLTQSESTMMELNEVLKRVYELSVKTSNGTNTEEDLKATASEVGQLMQHVVTLANASLSDKFVFGGYNVTSNPFRLEEVDVKALSDPSSPDYDPAHADYDPKYDSSVTNPPYTQPDKIQKLLFNGVDMKTKDPAEQQQLKSLNNTISYEIGFSIDLEVSLPGADVIGIGKDNNIFYKIQDFYNDLMNGNLNDLQPYIGIFKDLQDNTMAHVATVGGRINRLDLLGDRYSQDDINYQQMQSDVEDLDLAKAIMDFSMAEAVYRASLGVGGRILQPTLMDFLR